MVKKVLAGVTVAVAAVVALFFGDGLGWDVDTVLFLGVGIGAVLGLAPGSPLPRLGGFALGLLAAAIGYGLRAALLPDSTGGRAIAIVVVVALVVGFILLTFGRVPLWTGFLGVAALAGVYEVAFTDSPGSFLTTLPADLSLLVFMAAVGFAATVLFADDDSRDEAPPPRRRRQPADDDGQAEQIDESASLDDVLAGGNR